MSTDFEPSDTDPAEPAPMPPTSEGPTGRPDRVDERPGREPGELVVAMSPRQIIGGFALLAGLILMLRHRRRKR